MLIMLFWQIYVVIIDCISGEMFILVTNFFWSNPVFLTRIKAYSYQSPLSEKVLFLVSFHKEFKKLFCFLEEQFVPWRMWICSEPWIHRWSNQQKLNSLKVNRQQWTLHFVKNCGVQLPSFCDEAPIRPVILHFFQFKLVNFGVESAVENSQCTFHWPFCTGDRYRSHYNY